ncbi:MAG: response regulator [Desulfuromonadaceae bacterium]|nr:response regulator [Desulfuromonadaceae bacterium]
MSADRKPVFLIVDDDPVNLSIVGECLINCNYSILMAEDGESALQKAENARPDLILLDVLMPGIDGFETCRRLKSQESTKDIPVIFMTGLAEAGHRVKGLESGGVDYITKPFQGAELLARIAIHLRNFELTRKLREANENLEKRAKELEKSELRFRSFVENVNDIVFTLSTEGVFTYVSPNWKDTFGYELADTIGKPFVPFVHPDDVINCFSFLKLVLETGEKQKDVEYRVLHKNGTWIWYSARGSILLDPEDNQISFLGIGRDISKRMQAEEESLTLERQFLQAQKLESLGIMAGGIAHDFNNLLQSMLGNMELAARGLANDSDPQKHIASAMISGKHAAHLTDLMLTYAGMGSITKKALNLNDLVRENTHMLRSAASTAVSMELSLSAELPAITADEAQIQQLVMNLITNAAESIEEQPGTIRLTTGIKECDQTFLASSLLEEKPLPGRFAYLEVSDNGCGMSKETIKLIFDPFFTTKFTGRGLGMSAVMGIMRTHSGALFVESEPGKGTTFRALFPVSESAQPATVQEPVTTTRIIDTTPLPPLSGLALVVDDEKPVLKVCTKMVKLCGFRVITAHDGVDAVVKFREHADEIAVVLMDLTMPNMDGIAAMSEIYNIRPDTKIILASGFNEEELIGRTTTGQAPSGLIRKPYSMDLLEAELRRVVQ